MPAACPGRSAASVALAGTLAVACGGATNPTPTRATVRADHVALTAADLPTGFAESAGQSGPVASAAGVAESSFERTFQRGTAAEGQETVVSVAVVLGMATQAVPFRDGLLRGSAASLAVRMLTPPRIGQGSVFEVGTQTTAGGPQDVYLLAWYDGRVVCNVDYLAPAGTVVEGDVAALASIEEDRLQRALHGG